MRRLLLLAVTASGVLAWGAVPALAAESSSDSGSYLVGSPQGALVALVVGIVVGLGLLMQAYRDPSFGGEEEHYDEAHDVREGFGEHDPETTGASEMPSAEARQSQEPR